MFVACQPAKIPILHSEIGLRHTLSYRNKKGQRLPESASAGCLLARFTGRAYMFRSNRIVSKTFWLTLTCPSGQVCTPHPPSPAPFETQVTATAFSCVTQHGMGQTLSRQSLSLQEQAETETPAGRSPNVYISYDKSERGLQHLRFVLDMNRQSPPSYHSCPTVFRAAWQATGYLCW